jgi:CheY-like chemotaxis protein
MHMPEMDGLTLAQVVKADPRISGTVIVLLTSLGHGNGWGSDPSLAAYLTKPVKETALYDTLVRVLGPIKTESQNAQVEGPVPEGVAVVQRSLRILIAEDNAINQKVAVRMLAKIGCRADVVGDGREAVEALKQAPYDIVFMDCNMPEMDGFAATRAIRALEGDRRHAVIIAMTANALQGDRDRVLEVGMDDYIAKPVNQKELAAMIDHWTTRISPLPVPQRGGDAGQPPPRTEVLNSLRLAELAELADEGDTTWLRSLIEKYIEDTAQRLIELRQAIEGGKARQAGELAHALKGSSNNIGVVNLVGPAHELQKLGEAESLGNAVALLEQLESGFQEAKAEFEAHYLAQEGSK